ncbi:MAG: Flagellar hook capping protein [uncultured bacterium]|nr:MAG: Flagellar hook capping protein [uncultured bacterium]
MASSTISSVLSTYNTTTTTTKDQTAIDNDDFMTLLFTQLKNQDPMKPMDSSEMMGQIATLNSLNALLAIKESITALNESQTLSYASSLIGKTINAVPDTSDTSTIVTGVVTSMTTYNGETLVQIGDTDVDLSTIVSISNG